MSRSASSRSSQAKGGSSSVGPDQNGRHGHLSAGQKLSWSRLRRLAHAQRQRRDDRHDLGRGVWQLGNAVLITNTHSVGVVRDAVIEWNARRGGAGEGYSGDFSLRWWPKHGKGF